jgi:hypothetical protein
LFSLITSEEGSSSLTSVSTGGGTEGVPRRCFDKRLNGQKLQTASAQQWISRNVAAGAARCCPVLRAAQWRRRALCILILVADD